MDSPRVQFSSAAGMGAARGPLSRLRLRALGIDADEASFRRRGFDAAAPARRDRLERIGGTFVAGYNCSLATADPAAVAMRSLRIPSESRGFFFEGAAMGLAVLDLVMPGRSHRFGRFIAGQARPHIYMAYIGAGWALARTAAWVRWRLGQLDPLLRPLLYDGFGFHCGFFHHRSAIHAHHVPTSMQGRWQSAFDQGLGRAIWFVMGADVEKVAATAAAFPAPRRADLWSGIGLAAAYAGGIDGYELSCLRDYAGEYRWHAAQGVAFAAKARERAGNQAEHTSAAARLFCGCEAGAVADLTDRALQDLVRTTPDVGFEAWRSRTRASLTALAAQSGGDL